MFTKEIVSFYPTMPLFMSKLKNLGLLAVPVVQGDIIMINVENIEYIEANGQTTMFYFIDAPKLEGHRILGYFQKQLDDTLFFRARDEYIVNLTRIEKCSRDGVLILKSGKKIVIARRRKAENIFNLINKKEDSDQTVQGIAFLEIDPGKNTYEIFPLQPGKQLIGRKASSTSCDIAIENGDSSLSRAHFFIESEKNAVGEYIFKAYLHDAGKTAFVNKQLMVNKEAYLLQNKYVIKAGRTIFIFRTNLAEIE